VEVSVDVDVDVNVDVDIDVIAATEAFTGLNATAYGSSPSAKACALTGSATAKPIARNAVF
jgi:hypothetical protein